VRSSYDALVAARDDSARLAKELTELKNSRVQLIPPSAWVKREHKYKMDQEKHEHMVSMLQQRIERLELELHVLREGSNVKPLEQRITVSGRKKKINELCVRGCGSYASECVGASICGAAVVQNLLTLDTQQLVGSVMASCSRVAVGTQLVVWRSQSCRL
jgi:hypothetical protein